MVSTLSAALISCQSCSRPQRLSAIRFCVLLRNKNGLAYHFHFHFVFHSQAYCVQSCFAPKRDHNTITTTTHSSPPDPVHDHDGSIPPSSRKFPAQLQESPAQMLCLRRRMQHQAPDRRPHDRTPQVRKRPRPIVPQRLLPTRERQSLSRLRRRALRSPPQAQLPSWTPR